MKRYVYSNRLTLQALLITAVSSSPSSVADTGDSDVMHQRRTPSMARTTIGGAAVGILVSGQERGSFHLLQVACDRPFIGITTPNDEGDGLRGTERLLQDHIQVFFAQRRSAIVIQAPVIR